MTEFLRRLMLLLVLLLLLLKEGLDGLVGVTGSSSSSSSRVLSKLPSELPLVSLLRASSSSSIAGVGSSGRAAARDRLSGGTGRTAAGCVELVCGSGGRMETASDAVCVAGVAAAVLLLLLLRIGFLRRGGMMVCGGRGGGVELLSGVGV